MPSIQPGMLAGLIGPAAHASHRRTSPDPTTNGAAPEAPLTDQPLAPQQLRRLAELIAAGEAEFPWELPPAQRQRLLEHVRILRRARLIRFIARQIAWDIHCDRRHDLEND